jgi:hypothetical protein
MDITTAIDISKRDYYDQTQRELKEYSDICDNADNVIEKECNIQLNYNCYCSGPNKFHGYFCRNSDTIKNFCLKIKLPVLSPNLKYVTGIQDALVEKIVLKIGGLVIHEYDCNYLYATKNLSVLFKNEIHMIIPFEFKNNYLSGLPLISMRYHEVRFEIETKPLKNLICVDPDDDKKVLKDYELCDSDISMNIDGCYFNKSYRKQMYNYEHIIPITTITCVKTILKFEDKKVITKDISLKECAKANKMSKNKNLSNNSTDSVCSGIIVTITNKQDVPIVYHDLITNITIKANVLSKLGPNEFEYDSNLIRISELNKKKYGVDLRDGVYYIPFSKIGGIDLCNSNAELFITCKNDDELERLSNNEYLISIYCIFNSSITLKDGMYVP